MGDDTMQLSYDATENIMFVKFCGARMKSEAGIKATFDEVRRFWRGRCRGQKVYAVIDYTDFWLQPELTNFYAQCVRDIVDECTITTIRHTSDMTVRATMRVVAMKIHKPSLIYASREEAIEVVRGLRAERIRIE